MSGPPDRIPLTRPWMDEAEAGAARRAILSGWVTQGPEVEAFEAEFALTVGAPQAVAVSSCTTGLHLALLVAGVGPGDEVITPSLSFIAAANMVRLLGARPVFVDVDPGTFNLEPAGVAAAITPRTRAILAVHQMGMPADLPALSALAVRGGLALIEDAACAIGSEIRWGSAFERVGRPRGRLACFSFHPRKLLVTGDGGMITLGEEESAARLRRLRHQGMSVSDAVRHAAREVVFESYPEAGFNYRMTDIQAAIGRVQLGRLEAVIARRREQAARYHQLLAAAIPGLAVPAEPAWARSNWQSYCIGLPEGVDQKKTMARLLERGIATRRGIMCVHRESAHADLELRHPLPRSEEAQDRTILLPLFHQMTLCEQDRVVEELRHACRNP